MPAQTTTARKRYKQDALIYAPSRAILLAISRYHHLTSKQLTTLLFAHTSHKYTQRFLRMLTSQHYLAMTGTLPKKPGIPGSPPTLWGLTLRGKQAVESFGGAPAHHVHHVPKISPVRSPHLHAVNDVLIAAEKMARSRDDVTLIDIKHEVELAKYPTTVTLTNGAKTNVDPDGFVDMTIGDARISFCLELDRGTEHRVTKWLPKVRALVAYGKGPYKEALNTDRLRIAVVVRCEDQRHDAKRLSDLLTWTRDELAVLGMSHWEDFFKFTTWNETLSPEEFFGSARWLTPGDGSLTPSPLIPALGGAA